MLPEASNGKCSPLRMVFVTEDQVNYFGNGTCFVRSTIYIVHWDGLLGDLTTAWETRQVEQATVVKPLKLRDTVVNHSCLELGRGKVS